MHRPLVGLVLLLGLTGWAGVAGAASEPKVILDLRVDGPGAPRGGTFELEAFARVAPGWHIHGHAPAQPFLIPTVLTLTLPEGVTAEPVRYPPAHSQTFAFAGGSPLLVYEGALRLAAVVRVPETPSAPRLRIAAALRYQACNDTTCLPPATATASIEVPVVDRSAASDGRAAAVRPEPGEPQRAAPFGRWLAERGLAFTLFAVALLGVGLNLTPCVYPLLSVTVAYFGGQARGRAQVARLAALYVLGIALSFSVVGVIASLSGGLFGAALQQPVVVLAIAAVLVVLAMGSFGLYQFRPPAALARWTGRSGSGAAGALFMGLTMGVVAAPCVGPIVLGLLLFVGSRQDPYLGFVLFFALALGMGAPYVALALAAGSLRMLPRSGEWLLWTERLFGCVLLAMAAHFVAPLLPAPYKHWLLPVAVGGAGLYLGFIDRSGQTVRGFPLVKAAAGGAMLLFALWLVQPAPAERTIAWEPAAVLDGAPHDGARPLLVDFAAEWCIPCREMEHTTYVDPAVVEEADRFRMVKADITHENEATAKLVSAYDVRGVPTVVLFSPGGREAHRMVGYVGPDEMVAAMRSVR